MSTLFISCGPNAQEKAAMQQRHDDSLKLATENEIMGKIKEQEDSAAKAKETEVAIQNMQKQHDDSIAKSVAEQYQQKEKEESNKENLNRMATTYNQLQRMLVEYDSKLTALIDHKNQDAQFHFGRSQAQREQWLKNDQRDIDNTQIQIANIKSKMVQLKSIAQQYK